MRKLTDLESNWIDLLHKNKLESHHNHYSSSVISLETVPRKNFSHYQTDCGGELCLITLLCVSLPSSLHEGDPNEMLYLFVGGIPFYKVNQIKVTFVSTNHIQ